MRVECGIISLFFGGTRMSGPKSDGLRVLLGGILVVLLGVCIAGAARFVSGAAADAQSDPWTAAQTVQPADLAKELGDAKGAAKPTVICVAPHVLYEGGHIPGALFHGPGSTAQGIDDLKKWAQSVSRSENIVVYCGCCPLDHCPNLRPAFVALRDMGFTHLRALVIPTNFYTDWVKPGYPYEKASAP
jgi:thiosulfate/3-mercaptopyruvate sulfurtransferase